MICLRTTLPAPDGPMIAVTLPGFNEMLTFLRIGCFSVDFFSSVTVSPFVCKTSKLESSFPDTTFLRSTSRDFLPVSRFSEAIGSCICLIAGLGWTQTRIPASSKEFPRSVKGCERSDLLACCYSWSLACRGSLFIGSFWNYKSE